MLINILYEGGNSMNVMAYKIDLILSKWRIKYTWYESWSLENVIW